MSVKGVYSLPLKELFSMLKKISFFAFLLVQSRKKSKEWQFEQVYSHFACVQFFGVYCRGQNVDFPAFHGLKSSFTDFNCLILDGFWGAIRPDEECCSL